MPERWLKSSDATSKVQTNPYLVLPFSHGMRSCIARRFAEQNMLVLMLRVSASTWTRSYLRNVVIHEFCNNYRLYVNSKSAGLESTIWT